MTDKVMTLHELCNAYTISRRTVQGYEKHGLVKATGRNMRGYLLYDSQMQAEIRKVRQFQNFGFQVKEIKTLMALPKAELRDRLAAQKNVLEQKGAELSEQLRNHEPHSADAAYHDRRMRGDAGNETRKETRSCVAYNCAALRAVRLRAAADSAGLRR